MILGGLLTSCVTIKVPQFPHQLTIRPENQAHPFVVEFYSADRDTVRRVVRILSRSLKAATRLWGEMERPVRVRLFPNHDSLEEAVNQRYDWLRAWAMYDQLYVQTPRTWNPRYLSALPKLLTHELTHVLMYQRCCHEGDWFKRPIPFWFREGMASVTAAQESWRLRRKQLAQFLETDLGMALFKNPEKYLKSYQRQGYSLSHWMFVDLLTQCSEQKIRSYRKVESLLKGMKQGYTFGKSMKLACGVTPKEFSKKFLASMKALAGE